MPLHGRNDQAVTANSTTTAESTTGAPLGTHALVMKGGGANAHFGNTSAGSRAATNVNLFGNTTSGAFVNGVAVGIFGADSTETTVAGGKLAHAGWQLRTVGTGSITSISYSGTANGYNNTDVITVASPAAGGNTTATISTNATGGALAITITTAGYGFTAVNATPNVSIANSTGGASAGDGATFTAIAGGKAGRVFYETLVAMGSLGAQTASYGTPASVADASDDSVLADS
jgi:hypothetical protein